ncbi:TonB family protein [Hydrocarboniphaga sp.]|uniref:energy transducer TonB family protein n=1 Tax=Hydrocarboniphaga sp. TaxID=2033016 RepID=UPI003D11C510
MAAVLIKPTPQSRLSLAFATALTLHLLAALTLPNLKLLFNAATSAKGAASGPPPLPPPQATTPGSEVIPIRLPLAGFRMQTELGAIARSSPPKDLVLPGAARAPAGKLAMSSRLGAAAVEALAADQRARPKAATPPTTRLVAELRLATGGGNVAGNGTVIEAQRPGPPASAPVEKILAPSKPAETPKREIAKGEPIEKAPPSAAAAPKPAQSALQQPIRPQIYAPVQTYRGAPPENIAIAPPLPPRAAGDDTLASPPPTVAAYPGAQPAPDRGPGVAVGGRGEFFQKLTTHLFQTNQIVLAEAIRATPKLTVEVRFSIDRAGRVLGAQVMRSTGDAALDGKAADVILRASPVPQMPADIPQARIELSFPVQIYR